MKPINCVYLTTLLFATTVAVAAEEDTMAERPSFSASQSMTVSAVVEAINHESRVVTVRTTDGEAITFTASEEARNLDQVDVGDLLLAEYVKTVTIEVMANEGMQPNAANASAMARSEKGAMPGMAAMDATVVTATVEEINLETNTFKLKGPDGTVNEFVARNPENLKRSKVGDLVVITATTTVAITVEEQPAE
ncbi:MAG: hypothetical protein E4H42_00555 [Chromatiales bacterium]|nr:MAG: hypothetical protein E4H42_00555 [Chromatiales bacterium]